MDIAQVTQEAAAQGHIAIVDDERSIRQALGRLLRAEGYRVEFFTSGSEFLHSLVEHRPTCVLLDLNMPGVSGYEVLEQLARLPNAIPVIVITAASGAHLTARAKSLGARAVLYKPVDETSLFDEIGSALEERRRGAIR